MKRFEAARTEAAQLDFDELNVFGSCKRLYSELDKDNRKAWLELARMKYEKCKPHGDELPVLAWLNLILDEYDPVTKYSYENEVPRKRDRLIEGVLSVGRTWSSGEQKNEAANAASVGDKNKEYKKALGYWSQMTAHYCDAVSDAATVKAYSDAGVEEVVWRTVEDDKVCDECDERNGLVFKIDRIPPKPHWGCRCYIEPVRSNRKRFKGEKT